MHDLAKLVDELAQLVRVSPEHKKPPVGDVKRLIWKINDLSPSSQELEKLSELPIFPVTLAGKPSDFPLLRAANKRFSIIDRQPLAVAFLGKIELLDFKLEEVQKLRPFLSSFDLEDRYLSRAVTEISSLMGDIYLRSRELTVQLRNRAYALAR